MEMIRVSVVVENELVVQIYWRFFLLVDAMFVESNFILMKCVLNEIGFPVGELRLLLLSVFESVVERICRELVRYEIDLLIPVGG